MCTSIIWIGDLVPTVLNITPLSWTLIISIHLYPPFPFLHISYTFSSISKKTLQCYFYWQNILQIIHFVTSYCIFTSSTFFLIFRILILSNYLFIVSFTSSQLELEFLLEGDQPSWAAKQMVKYLEKNEQCKNNFLLFYDLTILYIKKKISLF